MRPIEVAHPFILQTDLDEFMVWIGNGWLPFMNHLDPLFSPTPQLFKMNFKCV